MISNRKIEQTLNRLTKWSDKPQWLDFLNHTYFNHLNFVLNEFDVLEDELFDILDDEAIFSINSAIYEDFFTSFFGANDDLNVINDYLKRRGRREPQISRQYLKALLDSYVSFYEVVEVSAKEGTMKVRDLLQEDKTTLTIQKSSDMDNWVIWDCVGARVISMNRKFYFSIGTLHLSRSTSKEIVEAIYRFAGGVEREISKRTKLTHQKLVEMLPISRDLLCATAPITTMLTRAWLTEYISISEMPLPEVRNMDNEEVIICEVRFPILGDFAEVTETLDEIEEFERIEETAWNWIELGKTAFSNTHQQKKSSGPKNTSMPNKSIIENRLLGSVDINSKSLVLSVNSAERAERGKILLESRLGNLVGRSLTSYQELEQSMIETNDSSIKETPMMNENLSVFQDSELKEYYLCVLDDPVPMLENKIPRKAATTKEGRSKVVEWLKTLENLEHRHAQYNGSKPFDMTFMWEELKIDPSRC